MERNGEQLQEYDGLNKEISDKIKIIYLASERELKFLVNIMRKEGLVNM